MNENKKLPTLEELKGKYQPEELKDLTDEDILKIFEGVETVWDYNPTQIEKEEIPIDRYRNKVEYFKEGYFCDSFNADLFSLFLLRGEEKQVDKYQNIIQNDSFKEELVMRRSFVFDLVP